MWIKYDLVMIRLIILIIIALIGWLMIKTLTPTWGTSVFRYQTPLQWLGLSGRWYPVTKFVYLHNVVINCLLAHLVKHLGGDEELDGGLEDVVEGPSGGRGQLQKHAHSQRHCGYGPEIWRNREDISMLCRSGMVAPPRGKGGGSPISAPPRKNDQNRGEVAGQNRILILNFFQQREQWWNNITTLNNAQSSLSIRYERDTILFNPILKETPSFLIQYWEKGKSESTFNSILFLGFELCSQKFGNLQNSFIHSFIHVPNIILGTVNDDGDHDGDVGDDNYDGDANCHYDQDYECLVYLAKLHLMQI